MPIESLEQNNNLSAEQQEKLDALSSILKPFIEELNKTNNSNVTEAALEEVDRFKGKMKKEGIDISDEQVNDFVRNLFTSQN